MIKPLLFLDVDGVLNILPGVKKTRKTPPEGFEPDYADVGPGVNRPVLINKEIGAGLRSLSDDVEIIWLSHWNSRANRLGALLGLPRFDFVAVPAFASPRGKTHGIRLDHRAYGRPIIWVDDDAHPSDAAYLRERLVTPYFAALQPDPAVGLRLQDIELIRSEISALV